MAGELDADAEDRAAHLCAQWGCGTPAVGRTPHHDALAARVATLQGLAEPPRGCPFAPLYRHAPPLVLRASRGLARMEQGIADATAFPGGVSAADLAAIDVLRRGQAARAASDDAIREKERKRDELARKASEP